MDGFSRRIKIFVPMAGTLICGWGTTGSFGQSVELKSSHVFPLRLPIAIPYDIANDDLKQIDGRFAQPDSQGRLRFIADFAPQTANTFPVLDVESANRSTRSLTLTPEENSLRAELREENVGLFTWGVYQKPAEAKDDSSSPLTAALESFTTLPVSFRKTDDGPVFMRYLGESRAGDINLQIEVLAYNGGYLDINTTASFGQTPVLATPQIVVKWDGPETDSRTFAAEDYIRRAETEESGADSNGSGVRWIRSVLPENQSVWLNHLPLSDDMHNSFLSDGATLLHQTNPARSTAALSGKTFLWKNRIVFTRQPISNRRAEQIHTGYSSIPTVTKNDNKITYQLGTPSVNFGTTYIPDILLNAEYTDYGRRELEERIRRELRIANWLGLSTIRLLTIEEIFSAQDSEAFLDTMLNEIHGLGMKAVVVVRNPSSRWVEFFDRYRTTISGIEKGAAWNDEQTRYVEQKLQKVPVVPVLFSEQFPPSDKNTTTPASMIVGKNFPDRINLTRSAALDYLGAAHSHGLPAVLSNRNWSFLEKRTAADRGNALRSFMEQICDLKSYQHILLFRWFEPFPVEDDKKSSEDDYSLLKYSLLPKQEISDYQSIISRYGTRSTLHAALESPYATSQINDDGTGIIAFPVNNITDKSIPLTLILEDFPNAALGFDNDRWTSQTDIVLEPRMEAVIDVHIKVYDAHPGIYHGLIRCDTENVSTPRYLWATALLPGKPFIDLTTENKVHYAPDTPTVYKFPVDNPISVIYGANAEPKEREVAKVLAATLEEACGLRVECFSETEIPAQRRNSDTIIAVGCYKTNDYIAEVFPQDAVSISALRLVKRIQRNENNGQAVIGIIGDTAETAVEAAWDFVGRYRMDTEIRINK